MDEIVVPTAREFLEARYDRRRAYTACITAFHVFDYIHCSDGVSIADARQLVRDRCEPSFTVVEGICNGSKHCGRDGRGAFAHTPGSERDVPIFAFNVPGAGWGQGRWSVPGLGVEHNGTEMFVNWCLQAFLVSTQEAFPSHFEASDWTWMDAAFGRSAAPPES